MGAYPHRVSRHDRQLDEELTDPLAQAKDNNQEMWQIETHKQGPAFMLVFLLFIYVFVFTIHYLKGREREREIETFSIHRFTILMAVMAKLGQGKATNKKLYLWVSHLRDRGLQPWAVFCCFPSGSAGS